LHESKEVATKTGGRVRVRIAGTGQYDWWVRVCMPILDINVNAKIISQNDLHLTHGRCTVDALNNGFDSIQVLESIVESFLIFEIMSSTSTQEGFVLIGYVVWYGTSERTTQYILFGSHITHNTTLLNLVLLLSSTCTLMYRYYRIVPFLSFKHFFVQSSNETGGDHRDKESI
jgi:hypothetical protein